MPWRKSLVRQVVSSCEPRIRGWVGKFSISRWQTSIPRGTAAPGENDHGVLDQDNNEEDGGELGGGGWESRKWGGCMLPPRSAAGQIRGAGVGSESHTAAPVPPTYARPQGSPLRRERAPPPAWRPPWPPPAYHSGPTQLPPRAAARPGCRDPPGAWVPLAGCRVTESTWSPT